MSDSREERERGRKKRRRRRTRARRARCACFADSANLATCLHRPRSYTITTTINNAHTVASWPGLLDVYLKHLKKGGDLIARRAGGDVAGVKLLRRLVATADDEGRCGGWIVWVVGLAAARSGNRRSMQ